MTPPAWEMTSDHLNDPNVLAFRVATLTKEKEVIEQNLAWEKDERLKLAKRIDQLEDVDKQLELEKDRREKLEARLVRMEDFFQRGRGFLMAFIFLGGLLGFTATYWKSLFGPWMGKP